MSIGVRIKEIRESKGIMQKFIEERMGQYSGWLSRIESGKQEVLAKELVTIAELLSVDFNSFLQGSEGCDIPSRLTPAK